MDSEAQLGTRLGHHAVPVRFSRRMPAISIWSTPRSGSTHAKQVR